MAKQRQNDIREVGISRENLIPNTNTQHTPNRTMIMTESQSTPPTTTDQFHHSETIWRVIMDIISLIILTVITVISHYIAQPFIRGFFCSDTTIRYPYKTDTIPDYAVVILSIGAPIVWMWTTEFFKRFYFTRYPKQVFITRLELCGKKITSITPFVRNLYMITVIFAYGYLTTWVLIEITKNFVGELRPHFIAVCQPTFDCSSATLTLDQFNSYLQYGINYTCLNTDTTLVRDARRSFFSGHTAPMFFGFGWLAMYIHVSWSWRHLGIVGHLFQTGFAILALYVGYTRIFDYHHHWQDVLVGGIVGSLVAFVTFKFILNWRHYDPKFLPYVVANVPPNQALKQNGGIPINNLRRVSPQNDHEDNHYF